MKRARRAILLGVVFALWSPGVALADGGSYNDSYTSLYWGHVFTTRAAECMYMKVAIQTDHPGSFGWRPYIFTYVSMDYARYTWYGNALGWQSTQCAETDHQAPPGTMHWSENLVHWVSWINNGKGAPVWCNFGPEYSNPYATHDAATSYAWVYPGPCMDQDWNPWFYEIGYFRGDVTAGSVQRQMQTNWLNIFVGGG